MTASRAPRASELAVAALVLAVVAGAVAFALWPRADGSPKAESIAARPASVGPAGLSVSAPVSGPHARPSTGAAGPAAPSAGSGAVDPPDGFDDARGRARGIDAPTPRPPWDEAPPAIRPAVGTVVDARTSAPIPGAWITWRLPPPEVAAEVLVMTARAERLPEQTMLTDARGRFELDRLPDDAGFLAPRVFVSARGYASASALPGLARDIVIALVPAGGLAIEVDADPAPDRVIVEVRAASPDPDPDLEALLLALDPVRVPAELRGLPPGRYRVSVVGAPEAVSVAVEVRAGETTTARFELPTTRVHGRIVGAGLALLVERTTGAERPIEHVGESYELVLPRGGRWDVLAVNEAQDARRIAELLLDAPEVALDLDLDGEDRPGDAARIVVHVDGRPLAAPRLGLVRLDGPDAVTARPAPDLPGAYDAELGPGRWAVFDDERWLGEVVDPVGRSSVALDARRRSVVVRLTAPADLGDDERIRVGVALVPEPLLERPDLRAQFLRPGGSAAWSERVGPDGALLELPVHVPGRYVLIVESDLGPWQRSITVPGDPEVEVVLGRPR